MVHGGLFPTPGTVDIARHGSVRRRSKAQAAQPQPTPSKAIDSSSVGWGTGTAIIPGSEPLLRADHPAPRYPRDRLGATLVAKAGTSSTHPSKSTLAAQRGAGFYGIYFINT